MESKSFNHVLKNPLQLKLSDLPLLNEIIKKHPYFQAPKAIRLKSLKEQESPLYNQKLKETAAHTVDRGVLFNFITSKTFTSQVEINTLEQIGDIDISKEDNTRNSSLNKVENIFIEAKTENNSEETIKMTDAEADQIIDPFLFEEKTEENTPVIDLDINAPLDFKKNETHSFSEWLKLASLEPIVREEAVNREASKEIKKTELNKKNETALKKKHIESSLIDNFLKNNPKISPVKKDSPTINLANQNVIPTEDLMTETLAKVYIAQKNYKKAIQAYKILSLKNPEKSGLFADQIRAIQKLQKNK